MASAQTMNVDAHEDIQRELEPGERQLRSEQLLQGIQFSRSYLYRIPFSLMGGEFVLLGGMVRPSSGSITFMIRK